MSGNPLDQFIESVDSGACRAIDLPARLWVFGGQISPDNSAPPVSFRDAFRRQTLDRVGVEASSWLEHLDFPENYNDWSQFSGYDDLLEFERDACYLARGVILFAESPGAYAELGALALDPTVLPRLMVVVESRYLQGGPRSSFLNLGPLKRVRQYDGECVIGPASGGVITEPDFTAITESIGSWLPRLCGSCALQPNNSTHRLLLLADLVDLFRVSKFEDLHRLLAHFNVHMVESQILRALTLLEFFKLVKLEKYGCERFAVRRKDSAGPWIDYKSKRPAPFDRIRFKAVCADWVDKIPRRKAILARE